MQPRLEDDLGWLLLALTGECATTTGVLLDDTVQAGYNKHDFKITTNPLFIPFCGVRRKIPAVLVADRLGEIGKDCMVVAATFNFPQSGPLSVDLDFVGREWSLTDGTTAEGWTASTPEVYDTVPQVMSGGGFNTPDATILAGATIPAIDARITFVNGVTSPGEEFIIGSYWPDDFAVRQRAMVVEYTYKWADPELCRLILTGAISGNDLFEQCITFTDFRARVEAPCDINPGTLDHPQALEIHAAKVYWQSEPVVLAGDDIVTMRVIGQVVEPAAGDYFNILLGNTNATGYAIPT
jgi:hypothetical protein